MTAPEMTRPQAVETAKRMYAGDWSIEDIRRYLAGRGHRVAWSQVKAWVDTDYDQRRKARERVRQRWDYRKKADVSPANYRIRGDIMDVLYDLRVEEGLPYSTLAIIARRFYKLELTDYKIRAELLRRGVEKNENKARAARERTAA